MKFLEQANDSPLLSKPDAIFPPLQINWHVPSPDLEEAEVFEQK